MKTMKKNERGGALLAVLLLIPVMTVGGLVSYKIANNSAEQSMRATLNENATFSATNVSEIVLATIVNDSAVRDSLVNTAKGSYVQNKALGYCDPGEDEESVTACTGAAKFDRKTDDPRYKNLSTLFLTKRVDPLSDAEPNTIAIEITVRTYNQDNPSWNSDNYVEHSTYQEFNMGLIKAVGCAAKYDFFANNNYSSKGFMIFDIAKKASYYADNEWSISGLGSVLSLFLSSECVDTPGKALAWGASVCGLSKIDCNATPITFSQALYGSTDDRDGNGKADYLDITKMNISGINGPYNSETPYPFTSLEKTVIDKISHKAVGAPTHEAAFNIMKNDSDVTKVGNWYFRDDNGNGIPDLDTPYFYHEGPLGDPLPFSIDMFRFRNVYVYVNGEIKKFKLMGTGSGFNFGKLYIIANGDFIDLEMKSMSMADAGLELIVAGNVKKGTGMEGDGISSGSIMANGDITLYTGMEMTFLTRGKMFSGNDIVKNSFFKMSMFSFGSNNGQCGCTGGTEGETTEMQIGRRFSTS